MSDKRITPEQHRKGLGLGEKLSLVKYIVEHDLPLTDGERNTAHWVDATLEDQTISNIMGMLDAAYEAGENA